MSLAVFDLLVLWTGLWDRDELLHSRTNQVDLEQKPSFVPIHRQDLEDDAGGAVLSRQPVVGFYFFVFAQLWLVSKAFGWDIKLALQVPWQ